MKFSQPNVLLLLFLDSHLVPSLLDHSILGFPIVHEGVADGGDAMFRTFLFQESHRYIDLTSRIFGEQKNLLIICGRWQAQNFFFYEDPTWSSIANISMATILKCPNNCLNMGYMRQALPANPCIIAKVGLQFSIISKDYPCNSRKWNNNIKIDSLNLKKGGLSLTLFWSQIWAFKYSDQRGMIIIANNKT